MSSNPPTLSFKDLRKHAKDDDCWIAVHSKIYDVTNFLDSHPGGRGSMSIVNRDKMYRLLTPDSYSWIRWTRCNSGL